MSKRRTRARGMGDINPRRPRAQKSVLDRVWKAELVQAKNSKLEREAAEAIAEGRFVSTMSLEDEVLSEAQVVLIAGNVDLASHRDAIESSLRRIADNYRNYSVLFGGVRNDDSLRGRGLSERIYGPAFVEDVLGRFGESINPNGLYEDSILEKIWENLETARVPDGDAIITGALNRHGKKMASEIYANSQTTPHVVAWVSDFHASQSNSLVTELLKNGLTNIAILRPKEDTSSSPLLYWPRGAFQERTPELETIAIDTAVDKSSPESDLINPDVLYLVKRLWEDHIPESVILYDIPSDQELIELRKVAKDLPKARALVKRPLEEIDPSLKQRIAAIGNLRAFLYEEDEAQLNTVASLLRIERAELDKRLEDGRSADTAWSEIERNYSAAVELVQKYGPVPKTKIIELGLVTTKATDRVATTYLVLPIEHRRDNNYSRFELTLMNHVETVIESVMPDERDEICIKTEEGTLFAYTLNSTEREVRSVHERLAIGLMRLANTSDLALSEYKIALREINYCHPEEYVDTKESSLETVARTVTRDSTVKDEDEETDSSSIYERLKSRGRAVGLDVDIIDKERQRRRHRDIDLGLGVIVAENGYEMKKTPLREVAFSDRDIGPRLREEIITAGDTSDEDYFHYRYLSAMGKNNGSETGILENLGIRGKEGGVKIPDRLRTKV